jgi:hypothetical protein
LARRDAIKAGVDNIRVQPIGVTLTLGDLMGRCLAHKLSKTRSEELSPATLGDYFREVEAFVKFMKPNTPRAGLRPEHFTAYMQNLMDNRKLGRHSRKAFSVSRCGDFAEIASHSWSGFFIRHHLP